MNTYTNEEIMSAIQEDRVIILPCKLGTLVYGFGPKYGFKCTAPLCINGGEGCHLMGGCYSRKFVVQEHAFDISMYYDFGKTIFLKRFDAYRAIDALGDYNKG